MPNPVHIHVELTPDQAHQYAQFLKRVCHSDFVRRAEPDNTRAVDLMIEASEVLRAAFALAGYAPR